MEQSEDLAGWELFSTKHLDMQFGAKTELSLEGSIEFVIGLDLGLFAGKKFEYKRSVMKELKNIDVKKLRDINNLKKIGSILKAKNLVTIGANLAHKKGEFYEKLTKALKFEVKTNENINKKLEEVAERVKVNKSKKDLKDKILNLVKTDIKLLDKKLDEDEEQMGNEQFSINGIDMNELDLSNIDLSKTTIHDSFFEDIDAEVTKIDALISEIDQKTTNIDIGLSDINEKFTTIYDELSSVVEVEVSKTKTNIDNTSSDVTQSSGINISTGGYKVVSSSDE